MEGLASRFRRPGLVAACLLIVLFTSGCLHTHASLTISGNDRVSGDVLVATETADGRVPFQLRPPSELADRVKIKPYDADGKVGVKISFHNLGFHEVEQLAQALTPSSSRYELTLRRSGSLVIFDGSLDLTPLSSTDSSFFIELSAPGEVANTNGQLGAGTVSWRPEPGELTRMSATYQFAGSRNQEWTAWALLLQGGGLALAVLIGVSAQAARSRQRHKSGMLGY